MCFPFSMLTKAVPMIAWLLLPVPPLVNKISLV